MKTAAKKQPWTSAELKVLSGLNSPAKIQAFLDAIPYSTEPIYRCPRSVLRDRRAHCYDGAMFAAAALRRLGYPPVLLNMMAERDDEHLIALFREDQHWGAVGKSNCVGLRFREPVYRSVRELLMSYFEPYFNVEGLRSLRSYLRPFDLSRVDHLDWMTDDAAMDAIAVRLDKRRRIPLVTEAMVRRFSPIDKRSFEAGFLGSDWAGLYQPDGHDEH
jgi:hypothetical protein